MAQLSDFRLGAKVIDTHDQSAGTLVSVLVDEDGFDPKELVVKDETSLVGRFVASERLMITDEVVIPISAVQSATHERVRLSITAAELRKQKPYISYRFKPETLGSVILREAQFLGGGLSMPSVEADANKPATEIEIERGEHVMIGKTGRKLGEVHDLLYDHGELIAVVIHPQGLFKHDVVLPIRFISRGDDMALFADIDEDHAGHLEPYAESA